MLPSQMRTLLNGFRELSASTWGGGANGQRADRGIGYSGSSEDVWVAAPDKVSDKVTPRC
ncbi:hypothetical protein MBOT_19020 [Mycobacterium botniense]|uniref:Uncharacterized protein n=1 Tax=Mycobacterium botniense TaxID=84962 RepID=A0A7I9XXR9_9MYCO|nr:hypothetical protein MBOT_19020 [Mycobacterium botniense]